MSKRYVVFEPGRLRYAKLIVANTGYAARKIVANASKLDVGDLVAIPTELAALLGREWRNALPFKIRGD